MATVSGYAITWNRPAVIAGLFEERFARGAFDRYLADSPDVACLWAHDVARPLARTGNGTLTLRTDNIGLWFSAVLAEGAPLAAEAAALVGNGTVQEMSVGFFPVREEWDDRGDMPKRLITEAGLIEVSVVLWGAYGDATSVGLSGAAGAASRAAAKMRQRGIRV